MHHLLMKKEEWDEGKSVCAQVCGGIMAFKHLTSLAFKLINCTQGQLVGGGGGVGGIWHQ